MMVDITATFGALGQGQAALDIAPAAGGFRAAPGLLSGLRLIDTTVSVVGVERLSGQLAKYAVKLALRSDHLAEQAAAEMVDLMRSRVPQDSGALLNGITWRKEGRTVIVEASAVHPGQDYDYALAVEAGHHAGGTHADASLFEDTTGRGFRSVRPSHPTEVPAQPFFWNSAREVLAKYRGEFGQAISQGGL